MNYIQFLGRIQFVVKVFLEAELRPGFLVFLAQKFSDDKRKLTAVLAKQNLEGLRLTPRYPTLSLS